MAPPRRYRLWSWHVFRVSLDRSSPWSRPIVFDFEGEVLYPRAWCARLRKWYHFDSLPEWYWASLAEEERLVLAMEYLRVLDDGKPKSKGNLAAVDPAFEESCPAVCAYLTRLLGPDKKPREVASLLIFAEDGVFKGVLNDRHQGYSMWASSETFLGLLADLDKRIQTDPGSWRKAKSQGKRRGGS